METKTISLSPKQLKTIRLLTVLFICSFFLSSLSTVFFTIDPYFIHPNTGEIAIDDFLQIAYGFQFGLIIFGLVGMAFIAITYLLNYLKIISVVQIDTPINQRWAEMWLGLVLILLGLSIAFMPMQGGKAGDLCNLNVPRTACRQAGLIESPGAAGGNGAECAGGAGKVNVAGGCRMRRPEDDARLIVLIESQDDQTVIGG